MAEGYLRHIAGDEFEPLSAGIEPKGLNPLAVEAMHEIGIDISQQKSKDVREFLGQAIPYVVTVCDNAKETVPDISAHFQVLALVVRRSSRSGGFARRETGSVPPSAGRDCESNPARIGESAYRGNFMNQPSLSKRVVAEMLGTGC